MDSEEAKSYINPDWDQDVVIVRQPPGSNQSGQCVAAMVMGCSLETAIKWVGKSGHMDLRDFASAFQHMGFYLWGNPRVVREELDFTKLPPLALMRVYLVNNKGRDTKHWMLWKNGCLISPAHGLVHPSLWSQLTQGRNLNNPWIASWQEVREGEVHE